MQKINIKPIISKPIKIAYAPEKLPVSESPIDITRKANVRTAIAIGVDC
ncbi:hypothetical protein [Parasporobacterium paucivorans]|nr:hypothetical protein [Parasporobacterium paucivorans]